MTHTSTVVDIVASQKRGKSINSITFLARRWMMMTLMNDVDDDKEKDIDDDDEEEEDDDDFDYDG